MKSNRFKRSFKFSFFSFKKKQQAPSKFFIFGNRVNFWKRFFIKLSYIALFLLFVSLIFIFFFTSFFVIENINLERENLRVDTGEVLDSLNEYRFKNILLISTAKIEEKIKANFPEYKTVSVKRVFPKTLMIQVKNYDIILQLKVFIKPQTTVSELDVETVEIKPYEQILTLNSEGIVENPDEIYNELPVLEIPGILDIPLVQGEHFVDKESLDLIMETKQKVQDALSTGINYLVFYPEAKELHLTTDFNYQIWVDFVSSLDEQIDKLDKISNYVDWNESPPEDHIDLRVKNRIIYK